MLTIGLTGSIAMGKSETAKMFAQLGCPVFDADTAVHRLYAKGGEAVDSISKLVPSAIENDTVNRNVLADRATKFPALFAQLEDIVHPLVRVKQSQFIKQHRKAGAQLIVLDIPLLFETGRQSEFDHIVVVSAPAEIQRQRALARPGMNEEKLQSILARQMPDAEKRQRADFIVDTDGGLYAAFDQVRAIVDTLVPGMFDSSGK